MTVTNDLLKTYADFIKADYVKWWGTRAGDNTVKEMIADFTVDFEPGSSYIRVVQGSKRGQRSSHSFIVVKPGKFPVGTILKSASWKAPAKNFARGNILTGDFKRIRWTGAI
jgi:hypothetical protein